jgi:hypothetical protein
MKVLQTRRDFLRGGAAASVASIATLAGCMAFDGGSSMGEANPANAASNINTEVPTALDPAAYEDRFSKVVDITEEPYNADPTGEEPIDEALMMAWEDDTLIVFPQGQYKMNRGFRRTGWEDIGLIGQNAVIRHGEVEAIDGHTVTEGEYRGSTMMFRLGTSSTPHQGDLIFGGFIFDWGWHENAGMQGLNAFVDGRLEVRNIVFNGLHSLGTHGNIRTATATPDSFGIVEAIDMREGGLHYTDTINTRATERYDGSTQEVAGEEIGQSWSTTGVTGHPDQEGTIIYSNIICGPWSGSPIYVRGGEGRKIVTECISTNGGGNQIRTNGGDAWEPVEDLDEVDGELVRDGPYGQTTIEDCYCLVDRTPGGVHQVQRGVLFQDGPQTIRNCEIELHVAESSGAGGSYGIGTRGNAGPIKIENCSITLHEEMDAVYISPYSGSVDVRDTIVNTVGWSASSAANAIGGASPSALENVTLNTLS